MFNYTSRASRAVRTRAQRIQERAGARASCTTSTTPIRSAVSTAAAGSMRASVRNPRSGRHAHAPVKVPGWGKAFKERLREFPRSMQVACHTTSLRARTQQHDASIPTLKDAWGIPAIRVTYRDHPDDLAIARFLQDRGAEILDAAGALRVTKAPVTESSLGFHLLGTCRMGNDPAKSVVDKYHRSHDVPEPVHLRRQQPGDLGARPAHHDHPGAGVSRRRTHRGVRAPQRNLRIQSMEGTFMKIIRIEHRNRCCASRSRPRSAAARRRWPSRRIRPRAAAGR